MVAGVGPACASSIDFSLMIFNGMFFKRAVSISEFCMWYSVNGQRLV